MTPPLQPLETNILCKREEEEKYAGTLIIPETSKEKPMNAVVVAVGPDVKHVKAGMRVICGRYSGAELKFDHEDYLVLRESEVLAIIRKGEK